MSKTAFNLAAAGLVKTTMKRVLHDMQFDPTNKPPHCEERSLVDTSEVAAEYVPYIDSVIVSKDNIVERVAQMGDQITAAYAGMDVIVVGLLKGCIMFCADLLRQIRRPVTLDFMKLHSYTGSKSGQVCFESDITTDVKGRHILIVDDLIDTGATLRFAINHLKKKNPASIKTAVLIDKDVGAKRLPGIAADYVGFTIPNLWISGYGMDTNQAFRNIADVVVYSRKKRRTSQLVEEVEEKTDATTNISGR